MRSEKNNLEPSWEYSTWEGCERAQLRQGASMTLDEKLEWLDETEKFVRSLLKGKKVILANGKSEQW